MKQTPAEIAHQIIVNHAAEQGGWPALERRIEVAIIQARGEAIVPRHMSMVEPRPSPAAPKTTVTRMPAARQCQACGAEVGYLGRFLSWIGKGQHLCPAKGKGDSAHEKAAQLLERAKTS